MTKSGFYPSVDHPGHTYLEYMLHVICYRHSVTVLDVPTTKLLSQNQKKQYSKNFSHESLYIRSLPDKIILTDPPFFVDAKSTVRKDTGNLSIEMSAFYFDLKRAKSGIHVCFLYEAGGELRVFSPLNAEPSFMIIQPKWVGRERERFLSYANAIMDHFQLQIPVYEIDTQGSKDPLVLIPINNLWECSTTLENLLLKLKSEDLRPEAVGHAPSARKAERPRADVT